MELGNNCFPLETSVQVTQEQWRAQEGHTGAPPPVTLSRTLPTVQWNHWGVHLKGKKRVKEAQSSVSLKKVLPSPLLFLPSPQRAVSDTLGFFPSYHPIQICSSNSTGETGPLCQALCPPGCHTRRWPHFLQTCHLRSTQHTDKTGAHSVPKPAFSYPANLGSSNTFPVFCVVFRENRALNIVWWANIPIKIFLLHSVFKNIIYLNSSEALRLVMKKISHKMDTLIFEFDFKGGTILWEIFKGAWVEQSWYLVSPQIFVE